MFLRKNGFLMFCSNFIAAKVVLHMEKSHHFPCRYSLNSENQYGWGRNLVVLYLTTRILGWLSFFIFSF